MRVNRPGAGCCLLAACYLLITAILWLPGIAVATSGIVALTKEELAEKEAQQQVKQPAYVDQLIDDSVAEDLPPGELDAIESVADEDEGNLRTFYISTDWYQQHTADTEISRLSVDFNAFYQTADYGDFNLSVDGGIEHKDYDEEKNTDLSGSYFTLQQRHWLVSEDWTINNTLGINRDFQNRLLSRSDQVNLSSASFAGLRSRLHSDKTEVRVMAGEKGEISDVEGFTGSGVEVAGLGVARHLTDEISTGLQAWQVDDPEKPEWRDEVSGFIRYEDQSGRKHAKLQLLSADGQSGFWAEGNYDVNRFSHQAGFYQLGSELHWMGEAIQDESKGAFWRFSYQHPKYTTSGSLSRAESDSGTHTSLRQSVAYNLNRETKLGGYAAYSDSSAADRDQQRYQLSAYMARRLSGGQNNRLQLTVRNTNEDSYKTGGNHQTKSLEYELDYSHRWLLADADDVGFQFMARSSELSAATRQAFQAGLTWQRALEDGNNVGASLNAGYAEADGQVTTSASYRVYGNYRLNRVLDVSASLEHGRQDDADTDSQTSANIALSYRVSKGKALGARNRRSGVIRGVVFYDENNDGIRQPLEKVAQGITIGLDGAGLPQTSDRNGEFEFTQIPKGEYRIGVAEESIPLPWELAKAAFQSVEVDFRQTKFVDLPLVRLSDID